MTPKTKHLPYRRRRRKTGAIGGLMPAIQHGLRKNPQRRAIVRVE
jgi:hypothetical protein